MAQKDLPERGAANTWRDGLRSTGVNVSSEPIPRPPTGPMQDQVIGAEDRLHRFGVTSDLLLIARGERPDPDIGEQNLDLPVAKSEALDARR